MKEKKGYIILTVLTAISIMSLVLMQFSLGVVSILALIGLVVGFGLFKVNPLVGTIAGIGALLVVVVAFLSAIGAPGTIPEFLSGNVIIQSVMALGSGFAVGTGVSTLM